MTKDLKIVEAYINEDKNNQKICNLLIKMISEVNTNVLTKINQIKNYDSTEESKVTSGQLDEAREKLDDFITYIMKLKV